MRLSEVIENWLDMNGEGKGTPVKWITILDVIKGPLVNNKAHAMTIYEYLKQESSAQQITPSKLDNTIFSCYIYIDCLHNDSMITKEIVNLLCH